MRASSAELYRCPEHLCALSLESQGGDVQMVESSELICHHGCRFAVEAEVPDLTYPRNLSADEARTREAYDSVAEEVYDAAVDWQFAALREDEDTVRESMVDMLALEPGDRVLEIGCGTGRDSFRLARRLNEEGALFLQDLSPQMVHACRSRLEGQAADLRLSCPRDYFISNASHLPFEDGVFDAVFHFGGFNEFGEKARAAGEFARVVRAGGRVVYGDESVAPWLRGTEFEAIVTTNNPLFRHRLPLETIPESAREVSVRWVMGNCFYVIVFTKGDGPPPLDLDLEHAGRRGGSMRTRYFGQLEGVSLEAKRLAEDAATESGLSLHEWLDRLVRKSAAEALAGAGGGEDE